MSELRTKAFTCLNDLIFGETVSKVTETKIKFNSGEQISDQSLMGTLRRQLKASGVEADPVELVSIYMEWKRGIEDGLKEEKEQAEASPFTVAVDLDTEKEMVLISDGLIPTAHSPISIRKLFAKTPHIPARLEYNPLGEVNQGFVEESGTRVLVANSYVRPLWMGKCEEAEVTIPEVFKKLIWHVIPDKAPRDYFFDWINKSLTARAYTFLVLCGEKGIGKGLIQQMIFALHGAKNAIEGKQSTLSTQFNAQLEDCRLIWFDEARIARDDVNNLKRILNDYVAIEKKGVDAKHTRVFFSAVISNNDVSDNYLEHDDRRFAPLELTTEPWIKAADTEWFNEFINALRPESRELAQLGAWILKNGRKASIKPQEPYTGAKFKEIVEASLARWQEAVVEVLRDEDLCNKLHDGGTRDYFTYRDMKRVVGLVAARDKTESTMRFPKSAKFTDFIRNHRDPETGLPVAFTDKYGKVFKLSEIEHAESEETAEELGVYDL